MRKLLIGALAGAVMLAVAAVAMATTTQTFTQKYTASKPGKSTGTTFATTSTEDQNAENNHQPKSTREFDIKFPAGTKINYKAVPVCKAVDEQAQDPCPKNTTVGHGAAVVKLPFPNSDDINATVTAYNRKNGLFLYVQPQIGNPVFLAPKFKGLTLKTATPPNCLAGTNQNGHCVTPTGEKGGEAVLVSFNLTTKAFKKGKKTYIKTPPKCTKAGWTFAATVTYEDGSQFKGKSTQTCKK